MGWIADQFESRAASQSNENPDEPNSDASFEMKAEDTWTKLMEGFRQDVEEFQRLNGDAEFKQLSDLSCRISNPRAHVAALVTADMSAQTIQYSYEPEDGDTAVPEGGVLSLRPSEHWVEIYSADQRLTSDQARQLILEPLLFPKATTKAEEDTAA
jgi:RNase H-fold protein (predicted Holliday junction resolvase)